MSQVLLFTQPKPQTKLKLGLKAVGHCVLWGMQKGCGQAFWYPGSIMNTRDKRKLLHVLLRNNECK